MDGRSTRPCELENLIAAQPQSFAECVTEKMLTYALGRGLERYDKPAVRQIVTPPGSRRLRFSSTDSRDREQLPFQMRAATQDDRDGGKNDHHA